MVVYQISREYSGFASGGGLGQVVAGIAKSLAKYGSVKSCVMVPLYGFIDKRDFSIEAEFNLIVKKDIHNIKVYKVIKDGVELYFFSFPNVAEKKSIYTYSKLDLERFPGNLKGDGYKDNNKINIIFQLSVLYFIKHKMQKEGVLLLHDSHSALIPAFIKSNPEYNDFYSLEKVLFLIHNAGEIYHQRILYKKIKKLKIIERSYLKKSKVGKFCDPMFMASTLCKAITVSNFYADELINGVHKQNDGGFGEFLNKNSIPLEGIVNGIDPSIVNEAFMTKIDEVLSYIHQKGDLELWGSLDETQKRPLFLFQNRITEQKGINELIDGIKNALSKDKNVNFIIMGEGEKRYEGDLKTLCSKFIGNIVFIDGYDSFVSKSLFACSDFFLITSTWEPCGITDMEASLFSSIPIAKNTGGLKKIDNGVSGFKYDDVSDLVEIIQSLSYKFFNNKEEVIELRETGRRTILEKFTWDSVVRESYFPLLENMFYG